MPRCAGPARCAEPFKVQFTTGAHDAQQKQAFRSRMIFSIAVELLVQIFSLQDCPWASPASDVRGGGNPVCVTQTFDICTSMGFLLALKWGPA